MASRSQENDSPTSRPTDDTDAALKHYNITRRGTGFSWRKALRRRDPYLTIPQTCKNAYLAVKEAKAVIDTEGCTPESRKPLQESIDKLESSVLDRFKASVEALDTAALSDATDSVNTQAEGLRQLARTTMGDINDTMDISCITRRELTSRIITNPKRQKEYCWKTKFRTPTFTKMRTWIDSTKRKHIHWLHGEGRSGTSTVLYNAAYHELQKGRVTGVASFSFGSPDGSREPHEGDSHRVAASFLATIVGQMIKLAPDLKHFVAISARSLLDSKTWRDTEIRDLVDVLIIDPRRLFMAKYHTNLSFFILLDDLHHCTSSIRAYVLDTMAQTIDAKLPIYYLIAARDDAASGIRADFAERTILRNALEMNRVEPWPKKRTTAVTFRRDLSPGPRD